MNLLFAKKYPFAIYLLKFFGIFCVFYYGTIAFIGLAAPGGYYIPFFDHYLNYVAWLRSSLVVGCKVFLSLVGFESYQSGIYNLRVMKGIGIHIGFDCLGYGVMSFWTAFILANKGSWIKKMKWISGGLILLWLINVCRLSLFLIAINKDWPEPLGLNHHIWFNVFAYTCIFTCIYFYDQSAKKELKT